MINVNRYCRYLSLDIVDIREQKLQSFDTNKVFIQVCHELANDYHDTRTRHEEA